MRVLSTVAAMRGPGSLSSIAAQAELSPSQTHRYLSSLLAADMLKQDASSGHYDLAAGAVRLGLAALSRIDAFSNADRFVEELAKDTKRTGMVTVWGDAGATILRWFPGSPAVITSLSIGSTLPLLRSATGHVFFAFGDRQEMDQHARRFMADVPPALLPDMDKLREEVTRRHLATLSGDLIPGLRAAAAPVFDLQGRLVLVVSLVANIFFPTSRDEEASQALLNCCSKLTQSLGGTWMRPADNTVAAETAAAKPKRKRR